MGFTERRRKKRREAGGREEKRVGGRGEVGESFI